MGHHGGGPGYTTGAVHAPDLSRVSACAMCAFEGDAEAERIVISVLDLLHRAP